MMRTTTIAELVKLGGYTQDRAGEVYTTYIEKLEKNWGPEKKSGKERFGRTQDTQSFTNHSQELVVALRDVAGLSWGGTEMSERENGDFMHFDCRTTNFGQNVYKHGKERRKEKQAADKEKK